MLRYKNLEFFDKNGNSLNLTYNTSEQFWEGSLFFPKTSNGIIESQQIYIFEEFYDSNNYKNYYQPHIHEYITSNSIVSTFEYLDSNEFFTYIINSNSYIEKYSSIQFDCLYENSIIIDEIKKTNLLSDIPITFNIAFSSDEEGSFENYFYLLDLNDNKPILKLYLYAESIGEDERLKTLCNNFGYNISNSDSKIFKNHDVNEDNINYIELNNKRKELLLEGHNIYPYIGSYKGLINAINFFGFDDLQIKEFWKNIDVTSKDYGKFKQVYIDKFYNDNTFNIESIDKTRYRKTKNISLIYKINTETNELDSDDLPIVEENYSYTFEDILIKLYSLKNKLKKDFLPFNVNIKDITGEATFFSKTTKNVTTSINNTFSVKHGVSHSIELLSNNNYIIDLRDINDLIFSYDLDPNFDKNLLMNDTRTIEELKTVLLSAFKPYYPNINSIELLADNDSVEIGCPIIIRNTTFDYTISEINCIYADLFSNKDYYVELTVNNIESGDLFGVKELLTNDYVEYIASFGDTDFDVLNNLKTQMESKILYPFSIFNYNLYNDSGVYKLQIKAKNISNNFNFEFKTYTQNGFGVNDQKISIFSIPTISSTTYRNVGDQNYYNVNWRIYNDNGYEININGNVDYYRTIAVILPYVGYYNLELTFLNTNNLISTKKFLNFIYINQKEADFTGIYRLINDTYSTYNSMRDVKYNDYKLVKYNSLSVQNYTYRDLDLTYRSFNMINLLPNLNLGENGLYTVKSFRPNGEENYNGPFTYKSIAKKINYKDLTQMTYKMSEISGDTPSSFNIYDIEFGSKLKIILQNNEIGEFIFNDSDLKNCALTLNNSKNNVISLFNYNYIENDILVNPDKNIDLIENIDNGIRITSVNHGLKSNQIINIFDSNILWYNRNYIKIKNITQNTFDIDFNFYGNPIGAKFNLSNYIHCAAKYYGISCDINNIDVLNCKVSDIVNSRTYSFPINDFNIIKDFTLFKNAVYIVFSSDGCKIPSKKKFIWTIKNLNTEETWSYNHFMFGHLFYKKGGYSITLNIEDSNGNKKETTKKIIKLI